MCFFSSRVSELFCGENISDANYCSQWLKGEVYVLNHTWRGKTDNFSPLELPSGIIVGATDVKTSGSFQFSSE